ncbi:hypothetical protein DFH06DRAFT_1301348 [Mycena polygramma]|nr:hypothetical protein DFH06DRAFT_1301348 [Mycena polygramma]
MARSFSGQLVRPEPGLLIEAAREPISQRFGRKEETTMDGGQFQRKRPKGGGVHLPSIARVTRRIQQAARSSRARAVEDDNIWPFGQVYLQWGVSRELAQLKPKPYGVTSLVDPGKESQRPGRPWRAPAPNSTTEGVFQPGSSFDSSPGHGMRVLVVGVFVPGDWSLDYFCCDVCFLFIRELLQLEPELRARILEFRLGGSAPRVSCDFEKERTPIGTDGTWVRLVCWSDWLVGSVDGQVHPDGAFQFTSFLVPRGRSASTEKNEIKYTDRGAGEHNLQEKLGITAGRQEETDPPRDGCRRLRPKKEGIGMVEIGMGNDRCVYVIAMKDRNEEVTNERSVWGAGFRTCLARTQKGGARSGRGWKKRDGIERWEGRRKMIGSGLATIADTCGWSFGGGGSSSDVTAVGRHDSLQEGRASGMSASVPRAYRSSTHRYSFQRVAVSSSKLMWIPNSWPPLGNPFRGRPNPHRSFQGLPLKTPFPP